jgi:nucleoside-diphosphate-sugar epimerase
MHVFITGGSALTGPAVATELIAAGHTVTGLARSDDAAARLQALGARALPARWRIPAVCGRRRGPRTASFTWPSAATSPTPRIWSGWTPAHPTLLEDMEFGDYFAAQPA